MKKRPFILGIAGGTGSGKTTIAHKIKDYFNHNVVYIPHDRYYKDQSDKSMEERVKTNYDHPDSLETDLMIEHLKLLTNRKSVEVPQYDFTSHTRKKGVTTHVSPAALIVIEGIRRWPEVEILKRIPTFKMIFITAKEKTRYESLGHCDYDRFGRNRN